MPQGMLQVTEAPLISPAGGSFAVTQTVTITDATPSASIFYTVDGTTPTSASVRYTGPLSVGTSIVLKAMAVAPQHEASAVVLASFAIAIPQAAAPAISPAGGAYTAVQTISLTDATPGAALFYTLDGSAPSASSTAYTGPFTLQTSATVNAVAIASGYGTSPVTTAAYTITLPLPVTATPVMSPSGGTFTSSQTVSLSDSTSGATIYYTVDGSVPTIASSVYAGPFAIAKTATVQAVAVASGYSLSAVASASFTITPPAATPVISPASGTFITSQTVSLSDATTGARIYYTVDGTTPTTASPVYSAPFAVTATTTVRAVATASGYSVSPVASATFTLIPAAATPVISPASAAFASSQMVSLSDSTGGATIYYTVDGTTPTTASPVYSAPFTVTTTTTVRALAAAPGYSISGIASATFTLMSVTETPVIAPAGGSFASSVMVRLSDATSGAVIFYTLDGSTPTASSPVYTSALTLTSTTTVKTAAQSPGFSLSGVASATFTKIATGAGVSGTVTFSKKALQGAYVSLYAAGLTGYGSAPVLVSSSAAITDNSGAFTVPYTCPDPTRQVYLVATGGQVASTTVPGSSLMLVTLLGPCGSIHTASTTVVDELTTVAAAWALAPFVQPGGSQIGSSSTNATGLASAFLTGMNLVDIVHGTVAGASLPSGATLPTAELNTLADALASCVNTPSAVCSGLFQIAAPAGGTAPVDTFAAAADIARHPANNVAALYALANASSPFQPILTTAPTDWTLAVRYSGGGLVAPTSIAIDQAGAVWVANHPGSVSKFTAQGAPLSPSAGFTGGGLYESFGLAVDGSGNVWVTNAETPGYVNGGLGSVTELSSAGAVLSGSNGYTGGGINFPEAVVADSNGSLWVANYGNSTATLLTATGAAVSPSGGYGGGQMVFPTAVAVDGSHNAWFANQGGSTITKIPASGAGATQVSCCQGASGIALDQQGNLWTANYYGDSVSQVSPAGTVVSAGYTGGGVLGPRGIAVDGAQTIWVANYQGNTVTNLQGATGTSPGSSFSGTRGYGAAASLSLPYALAVDATGSVWVTSSGNDAVVQFVGAATPVKVPLLGLPELP